MDETTEFEEESSVDGGGAAVILQKFRKEKRETGSLWLAGGGSVLTYRLRDRTFVVLAGLGDSKEEVEEELEGEDPSSARR